jgi:hypothetical protein
MIMDAQDAYYIALALEPHFKPLLLEKEPGQTMAAKLVKSVNETLHEQYTPKPQPDVSTAPTYQTNKQQSLEARFLQKLQPQVTQCSDTDRYSDETIVPANKFTTKEDTSYRHGGVCIEMCIRMAAC